MKNRTAASIVMILALAALAVPMTSNANHHCPSTLGGATDVIIFSGTGLSVNPGFVGCVADPADPLFDTDFIVPNAREMQVRWLQPDPPVSGQLSVVGVSISFCAPGLPVNGTCTLRFTEVPSGTSRVWDSQVISVAPRSTIAGGTATATVCVTGTQSECTESQSHTYRTVA